MPCLRKLRAQGFSFAQIANMLNAATASVPDFPVINRWSLIRIYNRYLEESIEKMSMDLIEAYAQIYTDRER